MSQIVSAYLVPEDLLPTLGELTRHTNTALFWKALTAGASLVTPKFAYSGAVLAVLIDYLEEHEILLPLNGDNPGAAAIVNREASLVLCAAPSDAPEFLSGLKTLPSDGEAMALYYAELAEEEWDEAGEALQAGLVFLRSAFAPLVTGSDLWLLIFID